jgi:membrane-bound lytic murein transglycosylase D
MTELTRTQNRLFYPLLGMLISAAATHMLYQPGAVSSSSGSTEIGALAHAPELCCLDLFADEALPGPVITVSSTSEAEPAAAGDIWQWMRQAFAMPDVDDERVRFHIDEYTKHPKLLARLLARGEPYLFYLLKRLEQHGMPAELALLPVVESAFDPFATSPAGASGIWQFMPATADDIGIEQNWWYDGRRDIVASTDAAIGYLQQLNEAFEGDWFLALAAYNAGKARVRRAVRRNLVAGVPGDYWNLSLPDETRSYVPKLLALKAIIANPENHGVVMPGLLATDYFAEVEIEGQIELRVVARLAGVSLEEFQRLNPAFKRALTAPRGVNRFLVPASVGPVIGGHIASLTSEQRVQSIRHRIRTGDNLSTIAQHYGTTVRALRRANRLDSNRIIAGEILLVPVAEDGQRLADAGQAALM